MPFWNTKSLKKYFDKIHESVWIRIYSTFSKWSAHTCNPSCADCKQINCNKHLTKTERRWITDHFFAANYDGGRYLSSARGTWIRLTLQSLASVKWAQPLSEKFETALGSTADNKAWTRLSALIYMQAESDLPRVCLAWLSRASETLTCLQRAFPRSAEEKRVSVGSRQHHCINAWTLRCLCNSCLTWCWPDLTLSTWHWRANRKTGTKSILMITTLSRDYNWRECSLKPAIRDS